jgi:hypothetical protein
MPKKFCININFKLRDDLIYYFDEDNILRLCIFRLVEKNPFKTIHNNNYHSRYYRCLARIIETLFIFNLLKKIRIYVEHWFVYQVNQTKRYRLYDKLILILIEPLSFYIIAINYVIKLLDKYDCLLIVINKFNRRLQLISNYIINFAIVWARRVLERL